MGSNLNFKNMPPDGKANCSLSAANSRLGNFPLARQSSVYSLTFDEFQNTIGGLGKDFGSMNMDEFLKNIWTAEETQAMAAAFGTTGGANSSNPSSNYGLQRQGSLTLPRTLSQKTVDEVWRDIFRENSKDGSDIVGLNLPQRQQTLGEMTLEEFLVRAGVVREDTQSAVPANNSRFYGDYGGNLVGKSSEQTHSSNNGFALGFMQSGQSNGILLNTTQRGGLEIANQFAINPDRVRSSQQQQQQQQASWLNNGYGVPVGQPQKQQQHQLFPKQPTMGYGSSMQLTNNAELTSLGIGGGLTLSQVGGGAGNVGNAVGIMSIGDSTVGIGTASPVGNGLVQSCLQGGTGMGVGSLGATGITVTVGSPVNQLSSDGLGKNNGDSSSLSPVPYMFNVGLRGRKCSGTVEKVVERRQRRMIKNRESAARSRARKQAYTMELEAEVAKLKEENTDLQRKQAEIMEMQKNQIFLNMVNTQFQKNIKIIRSDSGGEYLSSSLQDFFRDSGIIHQRTRSYTPQQKGVAKRKNRHVVETTHTMLIDAQDLEMIQQLGPKRQCLRRTRTGPW